MITFRAAELADAKLLHAWRNDPDTRRNSRSESEVPFSDHFDWLMSCLSDKKRRILIAVSEGKPIGTIRFDQGDDNLVEMSWTVAPEYRGRGLGKKMVQSGKAQTRGLQTACIKSTNIASIKIAEHCSFKRVGTDGDLILYKISYR